ncbi:hypothetical protein GCM10007891_08920 [Methylophaga thalassica]|uniref:Pilus assembly protein, PilO n=1 Tax=Methylophaga thalassica TaxID=40223 RepID=A0ABQ5TTJ2_9GAMM|nr:hypothetical protein [Methylophaga thalassica]GLP99038.1 hypothetical protein GCM10007891_08920 [Methylophaga thalassica]
MQKVMMEHYGQWLLYQLRQWGWQGNTAVVLLLVSIVISMMIQANNEQAEKLRLTIDDLAQHTPVDIQPEPRSTQITQRFYQALPEQTQANQNIADVLTVIEQHGLKLNRSDYSTREVPQSSMVLYHIKFPLEGAYPTIRNVVTEIMNRQQSIALSHINFKRDDMRSEQVKANIEFVLYTKADGKH